MSTAWMDILHKVKNGELSVEEGVKRMEALESGAALPPAAAAAQTGDPFADYQPQEAELPPAFDESTAADDLQPEIGRWKEAWLIPFWVGNGILVLSALWMAWAISTNNTLSTYCAGVPLTFGLLLLFLGWWSRQARWVHVRVQEPGGKRVAISIPLPLRLASWVLRVFAPLIPKLRQQKLDQLPDLLDALGEAEGPLSVEVDEQDGERVRVYIT